MNDRPLNLPAGSVRAIIAILMVIGTIVVFAVTGTAPVFLITATATIITFYFAIKTYNELKK